MSRAALNPFEGPTMHASSQHRQAEHQPGQQQPPTGQQRQRVRHFTVTKPDGSTSTVSSYATYTADEPIMPPASTFPLNGTLGVEDMLRLIAENRHLMPEKDKSSMSDQEFADAIRSVLGSATFKVTTSDEPVQDSPQQQHATPDAKPAIQQFDPMLDTLASAHCTTKGLGHQWQQDHRLRASFQHHAGPWLLACMAGPQADCGNQQGAAG